MMFDLTFIMLILVFILPFMMLVITLVSKKLPRKSFIMGCFGLMMVGLLVLGLGEEVDIDSGLAFMGEPITFSISSTAIRVYFFALVTLMGVIWFDNPWGDREMTPYQWSLLAIALSFGWIAFISGQFMIRYIALDIVGLMAALTVLSTFSDTSGLKHFVLIFQILRLGDLSLLAAILFANHLSGTLDIAQLIAGTLVVPAGDRTWIFFGFILAVLIKLAIWPFGIWLQRARQSAPRINFWISGVLMPALGYYLLYRITPIINSALIFQNLVLLGSLVLAFLSILLTALHEVRFDRFVQVGGVMSCFLLAAVAVGGGEFLSYYLVGLILGRLLLLMDEGIQSPALTTMTAFFPALINVLFIAANFSAFPIAFSIGWVIMTAFITAWDWWMRNNPVDPSTLTIATPPAVISEEQFGGFLVKAARWLNRNLEFAVLTEGIIRLGKGFQNFAHWLYQNVELRFEQLWIWISEKIIALSEGTLRFEQRIEDFLVWFTQKLLNVSEGTLRKVEVESAQKSGQMLDESLAALETHEQKILHKPLRWDLAWIPFFLVVILIMLFVL